MNSKTGKVTIAAMVLLVVMMGWWNLGDRNQGVALGAIMESFSKLSWVHVNTSIHRNGEYQGQEEEWECTNPKIHISIDPNAVIEYRDYEQETVYIYQPDQQTLTIGSTTDRFNQRTPESPSAAVQAMITRFESQGNEVTQKSDTYEQKPVTVFTLKDEQQEITLVVDSDEQIPLKIDAIVTIPQAGEVFVVSAEFDYPIQGPLDIYSLGVPADVQVIDNRPQGGLQDLMNEVQSHFDAGYPDHIAMVLESWVDDNDVLEPAQIIMLRQQGQKKRADRYHAFHFTGSKSDWPTLYPLIEEQWPDLTIPEVVALEDNQYAEYQLIYDGVDSTQRTNFGQVEMNTKRVDMFQFGDIESLAGFAWCNPQQLLMTGSDQQVQPETLPEDANHLDWVGFRLVTSMHDPNKPLPGTTIHKRIVDYWFDPAKDYLLMQQKSLDQADKGNRTFITQTLETGRTSTGQWVPTRITTESSYPDYQGNMTHHRQEKRILVSTQPKFQEGVFDKDSLQP